MRDRLFSAALAQLVLLFAALQPAVAAIEGSLDVELRFAPGCQGSGSIRVTNTTLDFVVLEEKVSWSADASIEVGTNGDSAAPDQHLVFPLQAEDGTTIFRSDRFAFSGSEVQGHWEFMATLECSTVPYQVVLSDTALPMLIAPRKIGIVGAVLALGGVFLIRRRSHAQLP